MSFTLVLLPQELDDSFIGRLGIIALEGIESLEVDEGEKFGVGGSAKSRPEGSMEGYIPFPSAKIDKRVGPLGPLL